MKYNFHIGIGLRTGVGDDFTIMTSSNGSTFRVNGHLCGEFTDHRWIPSTEASDTELYVFFYLRLNKRLSKQSWGWWFETTSRPLWRHCNTVKFSLLIQTLWKIGYIVIPGYGIANELRMGRQHSSNVASSIESGWLQIEISIKIPGLIVIIMCKTMIMMILSATYTIICGC